MIDMPVPDDWMPRLSAAIAATVREFASGLRDMPVALLAVDCHPWHGSVGLSVLTAEEADADALLNDPAEMAAWRHHDFSAGFASWQSAVLLGRSMQAAYEGGRRSAGDGRCLLRGLCRRSRQPGGRRGRGVAGAGERLPVSVAHPDDGREFLPPVTGVGP